MLSTIVIIDPYEGIGDYGQIKMYEYEVEYLEDVIHITEADSSDSEYDYVEEDVEIEDRVEYPALIYTPDWLKKLQR